MLFTQETFRLEARIESHAKMINALSGSAPAAWRGADWRFDIACFLGDVLVGVSGLSSLTLEIKPFATPSGSALISVTIDDQSIDNTLTLATWADGTQQHATFSIPRTSTNLSLGGAASANFFLTIHGLTTDDPAKRVVVGTTVLRVDEAGISTAAPPAPGDPGSYTTTESDARYLQDITAATPLQSTGGRSPTLSIAPGTIEGQTLVWDDTNEVWIPGAPSGTPYATDANTGKIYPIIATTENGVALVTLGPAIN